MLMASIDQTSKDLADSALTPRAGEAGFMIEHGA